MIVASQQTAPSLLVPFAMGTAAAVGAALYLRSRRQGKQEHVQAAPPAPPPPPPGRWVYPLPRWRGRAPVVSDGWGSPRRPSARGSTHMGVDIMYRRRALRELVEEFPPRKPHSLWHFMPPGTLVLAASDADVWSAGWTARGYSVVLSHGAPWSTYYTHMSSLRIGETKRGASKERVRAGQPLGVVGADPTDPNGIEHLHYEMRHDGGGEAAVDPLLYLRNFVVIDSPEVN